MLWALPWGVDTTFLEIPLQWTWNSLLLYFHAESLITFVVGQTHQSRRAGLIYGLKKSSSPHLAEGCCLRTVWFHWCNEGFFPL